MRPFLELSTPQRLGFGSHYDETVHFLRSVRQFVDRGLAEGSRFMVNPAPLRTIGPAAALCLTAEFDRWQVLSAKGPLYPYTLRDWDPLIVRQLSDMGFFDILRSKVPSALREGGLGPVRWIRFCTDEVADGQRSLEFRRAVGGALADRTVLGMKLYRSLLEAFNNVVEHAYPTSFEMTSGAPRRWWLTGTVDELNGRLRIVLLDQGISIPGSLPRSTWWRELLSSMHEWIGAANDGELIAAAMAYGRSRLRQTQRGKGLSDVYNLALDNPRNRLRIISRRGLWVFANGTEEYHTRDDALQGTLIDWDLSLPQTPEATIRRQPQ